MVFSGSRHISLPRNGTFCLSPALFLKPSVFSLFLVMLSRLGSLFNNLQLSNPECAGPASKRSRFSMLITTDLNPLVDM